MKCLVAVCPLPATVGVFGRDEIAYCPRHAAWIEALADNKYRWQDASVEAVEAAGDMQWRLI